MTVLSDLRDQLLANFLTIYISAPASGPEPGDWFARMKAKRAGQPAAASVWDRLRRLLLANGHRSFLHHLEQDPEGGWRLHFFLLDREARALVQEHARTSIGPGDPANFDPERFLAARIRNQMPDDS